MKIHTIISLILFFPIFTVNSQVTSDFESDIEGWYSEGDGDYLWEIGTGNPGNNFRVNDDATGDINLSYAPVKFLGNWSNATTSDYISADIFLHQNSGSYIENNFVFQIEGPGVKHRHCSEQILRLIPGKTIRLQSILQTGPWLMATGTALYSKLMK